MKQVTKAAIIAAMEANPTGFYIDHKFPTALTEGFPMYKDAPIVGQWLESLGFTVVETKDKDTLGWAKTAEGIKVYRGGFVWR